MCTTCAFYLQYVPLIAFYLQYVPLIVLPVNLFFLSHCCSDCIHCTACNLHCCCATYCWFSLCCLILFFLVMPLTSVVSLFCFPLYSSCCVVLSYDTSCYSELFLVVTSFVITICYSDSDSPLYPLQWKRVTIEGVDEFLNQ